MSGSASVRAAVDEVNVIEPLPELDAAEDETGAAMPPGFTMTADGLMWCDDSNEIRVAGPFKVVAETRDSHGTSWGLLLHWRDNDGSEHELALPRAALAGDGADARRLLLDGGLFVSPERKAREKLTVFLLSVRTPKRCRATDRVGWHDGVFVLPDGAYGGDGSERLLLQGERASHQASQVACTLAEWNNEVARYARGNTRLTLAISAAFAAPLLKPCSGEGGGIHFKGASSIGKTTALIAAGSVWAGGGATGFVRSWRATANGLEAVAMDHCDALLCLDEMSQLSPQDAGEVAYMLANGSGKSRANRNGGARPSSRWRVLMLSSGEIGLADKVAERGNGNRARAGQQVRIVDVPADAGAGLGIFEELHNFGSAEALARHLRAAAARNHGSAARAFLNEIVGDLDSVTKATLDHLAAFTNKYVPSGSDGQVHRVAQRFGFVAAAGELAVAAGVITAWAGGEATSAAAKCFADWLAERGGTGPIETQEGTTRVRAFLLAHGDARFVPAWEEGEPSRLPIRDLAGYRRLTEDGWDYYVTPDAWREEICRGLDGKNIAEAMAKSGFLEKGAEGRLADSVRVPARGRRRLYHIRAQFLEDGAEHG